MTAAGKTKRKPPAKNKRAPTDGQRPNGTEYHGQPGGCPYFCPSPIGMPKKTAAACPQGSLRPLGAGLFPEPRKKTGRKRGPG